MPVPLLGCLVLVLCLAAASCALWRRNASLRRQLRAARAAEANAAAAATAASAPETARWRVAASEARAEGDNLRLQLRETQRELASLSYSISHDMRAPLRSIDGFSQALAEDHAHSLDATAHDYLRRVRSNAAQLNLLIDDLLSLSRIIRAPFRPEQVDLSALVTAAAAELSAAEPMRQLVWDVQPGICAFGDRALLDVALRHLLVNAWKFTAGRLAPRISFRVLDAPGADWPEGVPVYEVRDNGAGFDMQYAGKLFGAFQRMHPPEDFPSGRGIGLATVQRIVSRHCGIVRADAVPQQGAAFAFTLRAAGANESAALTLDDVSSGVVMRPAERVDAARHSTSTR
jgi:light-regulated signal transduction histidine kinase (bacteriophytochrome)